MATAKINLVIDIQGLGNMTPIKDSFESSVIPEIAIHIPYQVQETADSEEALNVTGIDDVDGVWIRAIENDISVDTSFDTTFETELIIKEGTSQYFCPSGIVYIMNNTGTEKITFEALIHGRQD